jgi:hypothetical protein
MDGWSTCLWTRSNTRDEDVKTASVRRQIAKTFADLCCAHYKGTNGRIAPRVAVPAVQCKFGNWSRHAACTGHKRPSHHAHTFRCTLIAEQNMQRRLHWRAFGASASANPLAEATIVQHISSPHCHLLHMRCIHRNFFCETISAMQ